MILLDKCWQRSLLSVVLVGLGSLAVGGEQKAVRPSDAGKRRVETAARAVLAETRPARRDPTKLAVERPANRLVADSAASATRNPSVEPGLVRWHADLDSALAAAQASGKPVLLFQMLGKLDDLFC